MRVHSLDGRVFEMDEKTLESFRISDEELAKLVGSPPDLAEPLPPGQMPPPPKPPPGVAEAMARQQQQEQTQEELGEWHPNENVTVRHLPGQIVIDIRQPGGSGEQRPQQ